MSSTRLPGKVLAPIGDSTLLGYLLERVRRASELDEVVVATSTSPDDDRIAAWCAAGGTTCYRGDLEDVLERFHGAAIESRAGIVVRLTADCPLIDPRIIDAVVKFRREHDLDYAANTVPPENCTFPDGMDVEVFTATALEKAWREATLPSEREHVTFHLWHHPDRFRCGRLDLPRDRSDYRLTVDHPEDLDLVRALVAAIGPTAGMDEILDYLDAHPEIMNKNRGIARNAGWHSAFAKDRKAVTP